MHSSVKIGFIDIEIHHARIWSSDLSNVGIAESPSGLGCTAPLFQLCLNAGISAFHHPGNHSVPFSIPLKIRNHFAYSAASITFTQPGSDIRMVIIQSFQFLEVTRTTGTSRSFTAGSIL